MNGSIEILAIYEQILDKLIPSNKRGEQIKSQLKYSDIIHVIQNCTKQKKPVLFNYHSYRKQGNYMCSFKSPANLNAFW